MEEICESALAVSPERREAYLDAACAGDATLRDDVEALISSNELADQFIKPRHFDTIPATEQDDPRTDGFTDRMAGRRVGNYQVVREIGRGGMGAVYLAVRADDEFQRRVAIKLVKRGMDTDFILRRFRNERQILANFDHPNIARLFDGGTTDDGLPYFVMEYIEGRPVTLYCDEQKLSVHERLRLFRQICSAVDYAHQMRVVHRDIKPGNILVTAAGVPKLLDFGIAKILNPELVGNTLDPTSVAHRLMTPEYASPEQVRGLPATAASDIYSLGVLLYELLSGHRPYRLRGLLPHEMARIICEEDPERPSAAVGRVEELFGPEDDGSPTVIITPDVVGQNRTSTPESLRRELAGNLDNIVMKAMQKEPSRRYTAVEEFSDDIWRHLEGVPVSAPTVLFISQAPRSRPTGEVASIAVLPFQLMSSCGEEGEELLGVGLADAVITRLSNVPSVTVRPTSAVLKYRDGARDPLTAGYELNVDSVLDGRVQHLGERVRVTVQLVSMGNGAPMWAETFDEKFTDILSVQDAVSEQVARALTDKLSGKERRRLARRYTENADAYQAYLRGRRFADKYSEEALNQAVGHFAEAIRIDPQYALAHAGVADYYNWLGVWGVLAPDRSVALAKESALRALEIDDTLAEAHSALAFARWSFDHDWEGAEAGFRRAIELNPDYAVTHHYYAFLLSAEGRHDEALEAIKRAQTIDPHSLGISTARALILHNARRPDESGEQLRRSLEIDPQSYISQQGMAWGLAQSGRYDEALAAVQRAVEQSARQPFVLWTLGYVLAVSGRREEAVKVVEELQEVYRKYYVSPYYIGFIYAGLGMRDEAFKWFEEAYTRRDFWLLWMNVEPRLDPLRGDPRFKDLSQRVGPPESLRLRHRAETEPVSPAPETGTFTGFRFLRRRPARVAFAASALAAVVLASVGFYYYWNAGKPPARLSANPLRVTNNPAIDQHPDWSPDGKRVAFTSNRDGKPDIYVMDWDGQNVRRLTHNTAEDFAPVWSPDGSRIAFTSKRDGNDEIYVMNADGSNQTKLTDTPAADSRPAWSPDGRRLAFASNRDSAPDTFDIYVMNADGTAPKRLTDDPAFDSDPAWSPDGAKIAFASNRDGNFEVFVMNDDGTRQTNLTTNLAFDGKPVWSPDGKQLAFTSNRDNEPSNFDVFLMGADGSAPHKLTNDAATDDEPSWSPDGTKLVFQSERDVNYEIYIADLSSQPRPSGQPKAAPGVRSIAVLPFQSVGVTGGGYDRFLGVGLADQLSGKLDQLKPIDARPASEMRRYQETAPDPVQAGRELGVDFVLYGTVERAGERVHVSAQLISVADGKTSWAEKFDERYTDLLTLQESISSRVVRAMTLELSSEEQQRLNKRYTENAEAYSLYLAGRYHWAKRTAVGLEEAIKSFEQAIKKDENYALAYAGMADCYALLSLYKSPPPPDAFRRAKEAALKAIAIDDSLAEAHASLGFVKFYGERDFAGAEGEFRRALELNPNYATVHHWLALLLSAQGRRAEALDEIRRARELEPRSLIINTAVANTFLFSRQYDAAIEQCRKTLEMDQGFVPAYTILRESYEQKRMLDDAFAVYQQERSYGGDSPSMRARLAHLSAISGRHDEARRMVEELIAQRKRQWISAYEIAVIYTHMGDNDRAFEWLSRAEQERAIGFTFARVDPDLDPLRADPRFDELMRRAGLQQ
ncbi:MAG TPA: protein kinase [Pyrinomonadaceae bacterium]|nr:protein kinase [Pyrinomonadaceae bacterium]